MILMFTYFLPNQRFSRNLQEFFDTYYNKFVVKISYYLILYTQYYTLTQKYLLYITYYHSYIIIIMTLIKFFHVYILFNAFLLYVTFTLEK